MATAADTTFENPAIEAELRARIDQVTRDHRLFSTRELGRRIDSIAGLAGLYGYGAIVDAAAALSAGLANDGRSALYGPAGHALAAALRP
ncbi:hypothetical protein ABC347_14965 [Sphingomonas sp. 1P06PA]|uniref:hypothetical protein n=1 Tax=Sphingomonas sp. 1P06PA TaxID=554121 RepID=UPI0039A73F9B